MRALRGAVVAWMAFTFAAVSCGEGKSSVGGGGGGVGATELPPYHCTPNAQVLVCRCGTSVVAGTCNAAGTEVDCPPCDPGGTGGGNHDFDTAKAITADGQSISATLPDAKTWDVYKLTATKGDRLLVGTIAQLLYHGTWGYDSAIIDTIVTVYDANGNAIAQNDDGWPLLSWDSRLYFEVPADGEYYISVENFDDCGVPKNGVVCGGEEMLSGFDYKIFVKHVSNAGFPESNAGTAQDGTITNAVPITYALPSGAAAGEYGYYIVDGSFSATGGAAGGTHVFSFTPPADTAVLTGQRARAELFLQPIGIANGDGSTSNVRVWATKADGATIIAQADQHNYQDGDDATNGPLDLSFPVTPGDQYYLFVQNAAVSSQPDSDYYFLQHSIGSYQYGLTEAEGAMGSGMNDTPATAEVLASVGTGDAAFAIDGNLSSATDVDFFKMAGGIL